MTDVAARIAPASIRPDVDVAGRVDAALVPRQQTGVTGRVAAALVPPRPPTNVASLGIRRLLAVGAHPDDESFGLGAILDAFVRAGTEVNLLCFTRGEATTLGSAFRHIAPDRIEELEKAVRVLGIQRSTVLDYPDGELSSVDIEVLASEIAPAAADADAILTFDTAGITGHPDHCRVTAAARLAGERLEIPVMAWVIDEAVAGELNSRFGTSFEGRLDHEIDHRLMVDRRRQLAAIACHSSQENPVMRARLALQGDEERVRVL